MDDTRDNNERPEDSGDVEVPDGAESPAEDDEFPVTEPEDVPPHQQVGFPFDSAHHPPGPAQNVPVYEAETEEEELEPEREPSRAATIVAFAVVFMAVVGVVMTFAMLRINSERAEMAAVIDVAVDRVEAAYAGPGATDAARRRVAWLRRSLDDGDYAQARQALEALGQPDTGRPSVGRGEEMPEGSLLGGVRPGMGEGPEGQRLPRPGEVRELPVEAQEFFARDQQVWEAFVGFSAAIAQLQQAGADVGELARLRGSVIEAARLGQGERVESLLTEAREKIDSVGPQRLPESLARKLDQFHQGMERARSESRDIRAVMQLAQASEEAAKQGEFGRAEELLDRALEALRRAPSMQARRPDPRHGPMRTGPPQGPMPGPEFAFTRFIAQLAGQVMQAEQEDLTRVWESVNIAADAIRERNADQIREILGDARVALRSIGQRRRDMTATIDEARQAVLQQRPPQQQRAEAAAAEQHQAQREVVMERIAELLAQARALPEDEFQRHREELSARMLAAMTAPVSTPARERGQPEMTPQERVREKMSVAGEMYLALKNETDLDTEELDTEFAEVRRLITEQKYDRAEQIIDENVRLMQEMLAGARMNARRQADQGPAPPPVVDLDGLEIDLRGILEERPVVPAPGP